MWEQALGGHVLTMRDQAAILGEGKKDGGNLGVDITNALKDGRLLENE